MQQCSRKWNLKFYTGGSRAELLKRSVLGLIDVYNVLPEQIIEHYEVKGFQAPLQDLLKIACTLTSNRKSLFSPRVPLQVHPLRHAPDTILLRKKRRME